MHKKPSDGPPRDRPKPKARPTAPTAHDFQALSKIIAALGPLEAHDVKRVLYAAAVYFEMVPMERLVFESLEDT